MRQRENQKIEVSLEEWSNKISMITSLQQKIKYLDQDLKNAKEEMRAKDGLIRDLQKSVASFASKIGIFIDLIHSIILNSFPRKCPLNFNIQFI